MNAPSPEKIAVQHLKDGFRFASERAQKNAALALIAYRRGKKFKNVVNVRLKKKSPYFIRRVWLNDKFKIVGVEAPVLALWDENNNGWETIEGIILAKPLLAGIEVWS